MGVRDLAEVTAQRHAFSLRKTVPMPANNLSVVFERRPQQLGQARWQAQRWLVDNVCDTPIVRTDEDDGVVAVLNKKGSSWNRVGEFRV